MFGLDIRASTTRGKESFEGSSDLVVQSMAEIWSHVGKTNNILRCLRRSLLYKPGDRSWRPISLHLSFFFFFFGLGDFDHITFGLDDNFWRFPSTYILCVHIRRKCKEKGGKGKVG